MFLLIPWGIWLAGAFLITTALVAFDALSTAFVVGYIALVAYIIVCTFSEEGNL